MKTIRRTMLALLMSFSFLGLVACDDVDGNAGNGGGTELEEPMEP